MTRTTNGLDTVMRDGHSALEGRRLGLVCHPASVDIRLQHAASLFHADPRFNLCALFGPQHGIRGETQDNMIEWEGFTDPLTGLPAFSLYGEYRRPTPDMLASIDTLVVDLQDVGARYYTFVWTLLLCLEAAAEQDVSVVVLDRPNPLGGVREGNILDMQWTSFVGLADIPMRHGLTIGELARWFVGRFDLQVELHVVEMEHWTRDQLFDQTGLPWVFPSPNMPTAETALVYPGQCLLEGTSLSEGRGTTRPFEIFGAPGIDSETLAISLNNRGLPGAIFRSLHFMPTFQKHAGQLCGGAQIHVTDPVQFQPVLTTLEILAAVRRLAPDVLTWNPPPYEYETKKRPIDILSGGSELRHMIDAGGEPREYLADCAVGLSDFASMVREFELYE
jgi:uncharacterized protein YbbC (DUF1343 family)